MVLSNRKKRGEFKKKEKESPYIVWGTSMFACDFFGFSGLAGLFLLIHFVTMSDGTL